jgi:hypothetical protein
MEIIANFLTNEASLLPFIPVFAPASGYFSFIPFLSKDLLNEKVVTITGSINGVAIPTQHLTFQ